MHSPSRVQVAQHRCRILTGPGICIEPEVAFSSHGDSTEKRSGPSTERKQLELRRLTAVFLDLGKRSYRFVSNFARRLSRLSSFNP